MAEKAMCKFTIYNVDSLRSITHPNSRKSFE